MHFEKLRKSQKHDGQIRLCEAMEYSTLNGGKSFRAILTYLVGNFLAIDNATLDYIAAAMEMIHAFSLIHDDLPAMDDDELRRGKPTCHLQFDEATAILAGDALSSEAFYMLSNLPTSNTTNLIKIIQYFARSIGPLGMVAGQSMDVNHNDIKEIRDLNTLHQLKTGELIQASIIMPIILKEESCHNTKVLFEEYGRDLGLAFQIKDDLLDLTGSSSACGKNTQKDKDQNKATYTTLLNKQKCNEHLEAKTKQARESIGKIRDLSSNDNLLNISHLDDLERILNWNINREC